MRGSNVKRHYRRIEGGQCPDGSSKLVKLAEVESRLHSLDLAAGQDLIYELLAAYGIPQASITRLRSGSYNRAGDEDTVLWKKKVWDTYESEATEEQLLSLLDRAQANSDIRTLKPRFFIARSDQRIAALDNRTGQTLAAPLSDLPRHAAFFMPWAGAEQVRAETASYVDIKVARQMAKLYDEIIATSPEFPTSEESRRNLNLFFSRLLFCFFAEDTGVFPDGLFTRVVTGLTASDGSDTAAFLDRLFAVLDTPSDERAGLPAHLEDFGYVNGSLFSDRIEAPTFSRKARNIVVDCGSLDWSSINPDIFGSMIQAVAAGEDRAVLGMHYTSVENILKVLNPLFLDDLEERYEAAEDSVRKLDDLLDHLGKIKVFDPACGSGNFLIVAYKRLRALEHRILVRLGEIDSSKAAIFADSRISLENFYGIEIDDFAHDIAKLSLWFAKHQMNQEYDALFGIERPLIPLTETGAIVCANAIRTDWTEICPATETSYICGNPPYLGSKLQDADHKADFDFYFAGSSYPKSLDYVSLWFLRAADWISGEARAAFVSTNSISQGQHVGMLWPLIFERSAEILFAHTSFLWSNGAQGSAGVTCVVIGLAASGSPQKSRRLFDGKSQQVVTTVSPYLVANGGTTIVRAQSTSVSERPAMAFGSRPIDDGHLVLNPTEVAIILEKDPRAATYIRRYVGAKELLHSLQRFCLWIDSSQVDEAKRISEVWQRVESVRAFRSASTSRDTPKWADRAYRFIYIHYQQSACIAVPAHSSERRDYVPMAYFPEGTVISNANFVAYGAQPWLFAVLQSAAHTAWIRMVGGRIKDDYRYSNTLCYNTFPFPESASIERDALAASAMQILAARERWPDRSLAELYDPDKMPANLRAAHKANDALVDGLYRVKPFDSDADRMELLLALYRELVSDAGGSSANKG